MRAFASSRHAENRARPDSDVDLAYASDTPVDHVRRFEIAQKLAEALDRDVDLVDLDAASTVMQTQILQGVVLHCSDETRRLLLEAKIYKMYAKLNEERKIILDGILERGTVYEDGCRSQ
ncbi:MAG: hypothetical protein BLM47_05445 [Candidatus Reconcilbacillus cellulovorans]|uniref:Polymerase beta nucleotidyltransferase domain-containing protein n=1 Tax=Candidatus Reconcilbacillus cellulovorans TaxID=1906605 RepID=A0A2A6E206_9BACL|nr:MAG: hypothetical protein BLM47_05445 [Candidatus Reconcilbacillus cellulovorans]